MNYLREAAGLKPENCVMYIRAVGVEVEVFTDEAIKQRTVTWDEIETSRVNPIMLAIEGMT